MQNVTVNNPTINDTFVVNLSTLQVGKKHYMFSAHNQILQK